ncbi:ATP12 family chaperone protein [Falsihalocynthiibacter sp. SS001]|uniref:ATP12 family chaperone protein n=1 Tax=Falsihalocynthiibacter sp. SS001 TaxID=3349698 RepID=UPI0036D2D102
MSEWAPKRFWKKAEVTEAKDGYEVLLDGRNLRTPAKSALCLPTKVIANLIADEWQAQGDKIVPDTMPMTRMANSAVDKVTPQFDLVADIVAAYGETDMLCYHAKFPTELVERQAQAWVPFLDWAKTEYDAPLTIAEGVMHVAQPEQSVANLRAKVFELTPFELTAFHDLVSISGSLVLGLAAIREHKPAEQIWSVSRLDEDWQESQWGKDEEATEFAAKKRQGFFEALTFYRGLQSAS